MPIAPSTYYAARTAGQQHSTRVQRDEHLKGEVRRVHADNFGVYGARKIWLALNREGIPVARCTVERLMRELELVGARRGRRVRTTRPDPAAARPTDLVRRRFNLPAPNRTWVADFTYCPTWSGMVYVAFVIDAYSRRILGWRAATSMHTALVLDALEQAVWTRRKQGVAGLAGLIHHTDAGSALRAAVAVEYRFRRQRVVARGHAERVDDELGAHVVGDRVSNAFFGAAVDDGGQVGEALPGRQVGDVPDELGARRVGGEVAAHQVGDGLAGLDRLGRGRPPRSWLAGPQAEVPHEVADQLGPASPCRSSAAWMRR